MFTTNPVDLEDLLRQVQREELQLPDFQRDWVWSEEGVRQLIASIAAGFPVGAILTLKTGGEVRFKPRALSGAPSTGSEPKSLLLDGQQRMTSLYQSLFSRAPVRTLNAKGKPVTVHFYIRMKEALDSARLEDAIFSTLEDRTVRSDFNRTIDIDLRNPEQEYAAMIFPLDRSFDMMDWLIGFQTFHNGAHMDVFKRFKSQVVDRIAKYKVPVITLDESNSREAVCTVFEKVNVGGKKLDAFELLTAMFAADSFDLREDLRGTDKASFIAKHRRSPTAEEMKIGRLDRVKGNTPNGTFAELDERDVLQVACALQTRAERMAAIDAGKTEKRDVPAVSIKAKDLLRLDSNLYQSNAERLTTGLKQARHFIEARHIIHAKDVPYLPTAKTLAAVFSVKHDRALNASQLAKLEQWFWSVSLGETYGSSTDSRVTRDMQELLAWIDGGIETPRAITEISIRADRLDELRTRISAGYKALHAAILDEGCLDFRTGKRAHQMNAHDDPIDIHHIFPRAWCIAAGVGSEQYDAIVNKTPLFAQTNRIIGGHAPSVYLERLEGELAESHGETMQTARHRIDTILRSHLIDPSLLRADAFDEFYAHRKEQLLQLIEAKTGRPILRSQDHQDDIDVRVTKAAE